MRFDDPPPDGELLAREFEKADGKRKLPHSLLAAIHLRRDIDAGGHGLAAIAAQRS